MRLLIVSVSLILCVAQQTNAQLYVTGQLRYDPGEQSISLTLSQPIDDNGNVLSIGSIDSVQGHAVNCRSFPCGALGPVESFLEIPRDVRASIVPNGALKTYHLADVTFSNGKDAKAVNRLLSGDLSPQPGYASPEPVQTEDLSAPTPSPTPLIIIPPTPHPVIRNPESYKPDTPNRGADCDIARINAREKASMAPGAIADPRSLYNTIFGLENAEYTRDQCTQVDKPPLPRWKLRLGEVIDIFRINKYQSLMGFDNPLPTFQLEELDLDIATDPNAPAHVRTAAKADFMSICTASPVFQAPIMQQYARPTCEQRLR